MWIAKASSIVGKGGKPFSRPGSPSNEVDISVKNAEVKGVKAVCKASLEDSVKVNINSVGCR